MDLVIEGDELYTKVERNKAASKSEGWTIVLMERGSRFLWELALWREERTAFPQSIRAIGGSD
ncbi:hypothetical protein IQ269_26925 [Tychonema sp. LEGE 07199]|uniref:hypothetical protein n=1 Tax=Tychonema sp. LEGE 07199 TaxID=1828668 RepID=UPI00187EF027|nr:hypothetical protein [Tychonema sp. LEGE 07199]MBE9124327.1 hypothetical protein [Tychonema sp. LEGE 07199]MBE9130471.1 hypothetical protein [Tychonema sp. LEGE 07196]